MRLNVYIVSAFIVAVKADYKLTWYHGYSCSDDVVGYCTGAAGCCSAPGGINSVFIEWTGGGILSQLNWVINANAGCNSGVAYDTKWTAPGPRGTGCYNAHNAAVGSVSLGRPT